jgi:hypothetical protein
MRLAPRTRVAASPAHLPHSRATAFFAPVLRINPETEAINRLHVGGSPLGVVVAEGSVWFTDSRHGTVERRDPRTLQPVAGPVRAGADPAWLQPAGHYLFIGDADSGTVTRIDLRTGEKSGPPIRVSEPIKDARAFVVAPAGTSVWVSSFFSNTLTRISATAVAATPRAVIASSSPGTSTATRTLPRGGRIVARIPVPPGGGPLTVGEGAVWAVSNSDFHLLRILPGSKRWGAKAARSTGQSPPSTTRSETSKSI